MTEILGTDEMDTPYDLETLQDRVRPLILRHKQVITSTNDWAKQELESGFLQAPALLVADFQSAGRGRGTNRWWSALGNVAATFVRSPNKHVAFGFVPLLAGLAIRRTLVRLTGCEEIGLKWPNDLVVGQRKAAGLLCERLQWVDLIGVGVNVNVGSKDAPTELRERTVSLRELTGNACDLTDVVSELSQELDRVLSVNSENAVCEMLREYSLHHWPTGKNIEVVNTDWTPRIRGDCVGIDPQGRLVLRNEEGTHAFLTGSIVC